VKTIGKGRQLTIHLVCGARPNFMKVAPLYHALSREAWARPLIVHTGQHYDANMSGSFFEDLGLPTPDVSLGVGSGSHAEQTARVMVAYERVLQEQRPDLVVVVGDVNSTMAATVVATKMGVKVAHLEAGLRSFDRSMPEELNRLVTDVLADFLWTPSRDASDNLLAEGIPASRIVFVGNIMIDCLEMFRSRIDERKAYFDYGQLPRSYGVLTLHRPSNVDDQASLSDLCNAIGELSRVMPLVFPVHPRTRRQLDMAQLLGLVNTQQIFMPEPLSYVSFMSLVSNARLVITDSGGIQEETTYLGVPCLTLRQNTERPITLTHGTNRLCSVADLGRAVSHVATMSHAPQPQIPLWDGRTASRIVDDIARLYAVV
jgi:UDP-N-acetylglucosamine 2-epimerase (non-hydrolysing)